MWYRSSDKVSLSREEVPSSFLFLAVRYKGQNVHYLPGKLVDLEDGSHVLQSKKLEESSFPNAFGEPENNFGLLISELLLHKKRNTCVIQPLCLGLCYSQAYIIDVSSNTNSTSFPLKNLISTWKYHKMESNF